MSAEMVLYSVFITLLILSTILVIVSHRRDNKPMGEITVTFEEGHYVWSFSFYDDKAYEAIENMDKVTFKVKRGKTDE